MTTDAVAGHLLGPGSPAPTFTLADGPSTQLGWSDLAGRWVVVAFHVADWDPVAESQLQSLARVADELAGHGIAIVAISADSVWSHEAFARSVGVRLPLLADDDPPGAVATAYGTGTGRGARALFLIDPRGVIRWSHAVDPRVDPGVHDLLSAIERLVVPQAEAAAIDTPMEDPSTMRSEGRNR